MSKELNKATVEQAGTNVGHGHVFPRADGVKMRCGGPGLCSECSADASRARAALAQPSPSQGDEKPGDSILCYGCFAKGVGPEHFDEAGKCLVRQQTEPLGAEFAQVLSDNLPELLSTAQAEKAEGFTHFPELLESVQQMDAMLKANSAQPEQPEVVGYLLAKGNGTLSILRAGSSDEPVMTVAQHERIVGELRAEITQLRQHKNDYMDAGQETYRALQNEIREREAEIARLDCLVSSRTAERDAALARVEELERQEPVALANRGLHAFWVKWTEAAAGLYGPGIKLYAAPVAQAQQLNDLDKQCRDDVARALGLRPNQERGFAWSYLLASIKSCVKASGDSAQAQHSVPGDIMRDAQRYRWLRDQQFYFSFSTENSDAGISSCTAGMSSRFKNLSWVDAAIDSAIATAPGKEVGHE
ncbi:hypothetical protein I5M03_27920 [Pseudomonas aeruginosa]|nr:hypothetical protein [Pseudomonas aeruginosa]MBH3778893.1 hypothetical protein [Pseudomonas aeruginosa]